MINTFEKIGEIVYPVTYLNNGIIIVDYPDQPPNIKNFNENKLPDFQALIKKYNIKFGN